MILNQQTYVPHDYGASLRRIRTEKSFGSDQVRARLKELPYMFATRCHDGSLAAVLQDPLSDTLVDGGGVGARPQHLHHPGHQRLAVSSGGALIPQPSMQLVDDAATEWRFEGRCVGTGNGSEHLTSLK